mgnify:CR=1 FL=1
MAALFAAFMFLGLRDRTHRGSTHLTIVMISALVLGYAYLGLARAS